MIRFGIKFLAVMLLSAAVASCASFRPRQRVENPELANVKFAFVTADQGLPVTVLGNVQSQLAASIASTHRNVATEPVYLMVRVSNIAVRQGAKMPLYTVEVNTILSDTRDGHVVSSTDLQAYAVVPKGKSLNDQIAGAITERLRFTYNLARPEPPKMAVAMPQRTSTQIAIDQPDALLNATTKIEPADTLPATPEPVATKPMPETLPVAAVGPNFIGPVLPGTAPGRIKTTIASTPAKAEPAAEAVVAPAASNLENGAASKIVIPAPKTGSQAEVPVAPAAVSGDEPCVVTSNNDCAVLQ